LQHIESDVEPKALQLTKPPEGATNFAEFLQKQLETVSGISNVTRGNPQASLESGAALALVAAQSIAYNSGFQASVSKLEENVANDIISISKTFVQTNKVISIVGKSNAAMLVEYKGSDLGKISKVFVEPVNPMSKTAAGRVELANTLLQSQLITRPEEYLRVIEEGTLKPMLESDTNQLMLIDKENELLRTGETEVMALMIDNHGKHIRGHAQVLNDSKLRLDQNLVARVLEHIQSHIELGTMMNPMLGAILREEAPPPGSIPPPQGSPQSPQETPVEANMPSLPKNADPESQAAYEQMKG
jgi:hypothetical protein